MKKNFNIPILFFLILLLSKEVFSYDSEKVVILCILSFIIIAYFNFKEMLSNVFLSQSEKIKEEFNDLALIKENLEKEIKKFWRVFLDLEDHLIQIYSWVRNNLVTFIKKANKNRKLLVFHIIKDQLNILVKDQIKINQNLNIFLLKNSITNLKNMLANNTEYKTLYINELNFYFNKLINISTTSNLIYLIINKLNINKEFTVDNKNWINLETYLYFKYNSTHAKF